MPFSAGARTQRQALCSAASESSEGWLDGIADATLLPLRIDICLQDKVQRIPRGQQYVENIRAQGCFEGKQNFLFG